MNELAKQLAELTPEEREYFLEQMRKKKGKTAQQILPQSRATNAFPLSFSQQRLWFQDQLEPQSSLYTMPSVLRLRGRFALDAFEKSIAGVVQRHEVLRTTFSMQGDQPVQVIAPTLILSIPLIDLSWCSVGKRESLIRQLVQQEVQLPFNLVMGPLLRACILRLDEQEHVVLFSMHHIVSDAWSTGILLRELMTIYQAELNGESVALPTLAVQYADYAYWQRQWLQGQVLQEQIDYWRQQLSDMPTALSFPTDRPRLPVQTYAGDRQAIFLSSKLHQALINLSRREGATLFMVLLAAYQVLLMRYSGEHDMVVGSPIANRTRKEVAGLIGFFVNTLVLRTDLSGNLSFRQVLARVREVTLQAYAHQDLPFEKLVAELQLERDMSRPPVFQVAFMLQNLPPARIDLADTSWEALDHKHTPALLELYLKVAEHEDGLQVLLEYNTDLFEATTIKRLLKHWQVVLEAVVQDIEQPIEDLPLLTAAELEQQLIYWNAPITPRSDATLCLHQLFERQVVRTPDAVALVFEQSSLTYAELNSRANQLAYFLQRKGVGPDVFVGVLMHRATELVIALLAILKAGGAYVPLDPVSPDERLAWIFGEVQPSVVLTRTDLRETCATFSAPFMFLDEHWARVAEEASENLNVPVGSENLAYMIYTSGSTGRPKGVMIAHRSICNTLQWAQDTYRLTTDDGVLLKTPCTFDPSVEELFWPLITGARLVVASPEGHKDSRYVLALTAEQNVTVQIFIPSLLQVALDDPRWDISPHLRIVICGGEALTRELQERFFARHHAQLQNLYGPTEATIEATIWQCKHTGDLHGIVPLGHPITNVQIYLLDEQWHLVPVGVIGEICIGGLALARGYHKRADLTAERFLPHPFCQQPGERLYKTGDLARYREDGTIEFVGRNDLQVKIHGFRIELGEVEAVIRAHPAVQETIVTLYEPQESRKYLVAYIVLHPTEVLTVQQLRHYMQDVLPEYMLPTHYLFLNALPLTANGKVDRRALPAPERVQSDQESITADLPQSKSEALLAEIWADILDLPQVGPHDNFFELGGHSLLATQVRSRILQTFQVELPVQTLFQFQTVATMMPQIEALMQAEQQNVVSDLRSMARTGDLPLSFAQERLWFLHQLEPSSTAYSISMALRLSGALSVAALARSVEMVIQRHEALRTTFASRDGRPVQIIAPSLLLHVPIIDLRGYTPAEQEALVSQLVRQESQRTFNLVTGPLLSICLLRLDEQEHVMLFSMHHIISDGWSASVFIRECVACYQATRRGEVATLPALPIQYADYACWQRQWLQGEVWQELMDYWRQQLTGAPPLLHLPLDRPRRLAQNRQSATLALLLPMAQVELLKRFSQQYDVSLFITLLTALFAVLHRLSLQEDILIGTVTANRTRAELEPLIGCFINYLVLRSQIRPEQSWEGLLADVKATVFAAYDHQSLPFEKIVAELRPDRSHYHNPFYNVAFLLQNYPHEVIALEELTVQPLPGQPRDALLDLRFIASEIADGLLVSCEYDATLFASETVAAILETYRQALAYLVEHPSEQPNALSLPNVLLEKAQKAQEVANGEPEQTIAITATFTAEPMAEALTYWMKELALPATTRFAPYNQVLQQLLDPTSLLATNTNGFNLVLLRFEDWLRYKAKDEPQEKIEQQANELQQALQVLMQRTIVPCLVCICPMSPQVSADASLALLAPQLERQLAQKIGEMKGISFLSSQEIMTAYPVADYYDAYSDEVGHIPFTPLFYTALATQLARKIFALTSVPAKVIAVDCDMTLWRGVCGEDGPHGVVIDAPRRALQEFLVAQQQAGMLICLVSKNIEEDVFAVFDAHPEMPLKREHLAQTYINWQPKFQNLRALALNLNLALDSIILIDDNPVEQAEVQSYCPEVLIFPFPRQVERLPQALEQCWLFDRRALTAEDRQRTLLYQQEQQRRSLLQTSASLEDFLKVLDVQVEITALEEEHLTRAAQLTQRTNQMNTTTIRRSESDIIHFRQQQGDVFVVHVKDRFGAYGLVGLVLCSTASTVLLVDTLLLSCRVLGRGVEHQVVAHIGRLACQRGLDAVTIPYIPSARNQPVYQFLEQTGGKYKKPYERGWLFTFPAQEAAQLHYQPATECVSVEGEEEKRAELPSVAATKWHLRYQHIATITTKLDSAEKIYQRIRSEQRQSNAASAIIKNPHTLIEEQLHAIWSEMLNLDLIGIDDNFFALGGHSLLATQVVSRIRAVFQLQVTLQDLFDRPTIAALGQMIEKMQRDFLEQAESAALEQELYAVAGLSDEEIDLLLSAEE